MKIYDISMEIHEDMAVWKDKAEKKPQLEVVRDFVGNTGARESRISLEMHTGTHVDAPLHFVPTGETMDSIPLDKLIRPATVVDLTHVEDHICADDLKKVDIKAGDFLLLKTKNSFDQGFNRGFVFIEASAARYLADQKVAGVGIDALGVERDQSDHATHNALLGERVIIIEGLRLAEVPAGQYLMVAAPLKIKEVEAAPARVALISQDS